MFCIGDGIARWLVGVALALALPAQAPAPGGSVSGSWWLLEGRRCLDSDDPWRAWQAFQFGLAADSADGSCRLGLGEAHLMLGRSAFALRYAEAEVQVDSGNQGAMALCIRALIRARAFDAAVRRAGSFVSTVDAPTADLLAARASALFRVQQIESAASEYRRVVELEPRHAEAHLRLGSGLLPPTEIQIGRELRLAVAAARAGRREQAINELLGVLTAEPGNAVAHRLLGEVLFAEREAGNMAANDAAFAAFAAVVPTPVVGDLPVAEFVQGYDELSAARRAIVDRAAAMFGRYLPKLVAVGCRHNLLLELERTTDASSRRGLRGKRTFDGRVWDDVRGIGGLQAATGIESLDEAAGYGFDTIAHEIAHQVHFFALTRVQKARIKELYAAALADDRCIDYYAASNEAEYFGQGVEAFVSLVKRPGGETTHGHTRFELYRVDPALHDFVAEVVDADPLRDAANRDAILAAAARVALRCGRPDDAMLAAEWMGQTPARGELIEAARVALAAASSH